MNRPSALFHTDEHEIPEIGLAALGPHDGLAGGDYAVGQFELVDDDLEAARI
jgi:hypothetical protein